jgi:hypothetical protein
VLQSQPEGFAEMSYQPGHTPLWQE